MDIVETVLPDEIYYLAAFHHATEDPTVNDHALIAKSLEINTLALNNFLWAIAEQQPKARLFYAASSLLFADAARVPQDETTPMAPICPYGISKAAGVHLCRYYRAQRQVHASVGILYNHESPLRPGQFITRKIANAAVKIKRGLEEKIVVGDLDAVVDWGYAPEYVAAMWMILQLDEPDDFVIATGKLHTVRDLVRIAFEVVGLNWENHVLEDRSLLKGNRRPTTLQGNASKLMRLTGWRPRLSFEEMINRLVLSELEGCSQP
jgi:GDPmannose 4,6-dehydratase